MKIPALLTCFLRNLYAGQKATVDMKQLTGSKSGKEYVKAVLPVLLFNLYAEYILQNTRLDDSQARIKTASGNISNLRYTDDTTLMGESEEEGPKGPLDECERRE